MFKNQKQFLNIYYKKDGRSYTGADCYGLCYLFNRDILNKIIPDFLGENIYGDESISRVYEQKKSQFKKVATGKEVVGDIISLSLKGYPVHVGVIVQKGIMLHIMENKFASLESYINKKWDKRINSIWRYESTL